MIVVGSVLGFQEESLILFFGLGGITVFLVVFLSFAYAENRRVEAFWDRFCAARGFTPGNPRGPGRGCTGTVEGRPIVLRGENRGSHRFPRFAHIAEVGGAQAGVEVWPRELATNLIQKLKGTEIRLGVPRFDDAFAVRGPESLVRALLTAPARERLLASLPYNVSLSQGEVHVERVIRGPTVIEELLQEALEVAQALEPVANLEERLSAISQNDPVAEARHGATKALMSIQGGPSSA